MVVPSRWCLMSFITKGKEPRLLMIYHPTMLSCAGGDPRLCLFRESKSTEEIHQWIALVNLDSYLPLPHCWLWFANHWVLYYNFDVTSYISWLWRNDLRKSRNSFLTTQPLPSNVSYQGTSVPPMYTTIDGSRSWIVLYQATEPDVMVKKFQKKFSVKDVIVTNCWCIGWTAVIISQLHAYNFICLLSVKSTCEDNVGLSTKIGLGGRGRCHPAAWESEWAADEWGVDNNWARAWSIMSVW